MILISASTFNLKKKLEILKVFQEILEHSSNHSKNFLLWKKATVKYVFTRSIMLIFFYQVVLGQVYGGINA